MCGNGRLCDNDVCFRRARAEHLLDMAVYGSGTCEIEGSKVGGIVYPRMEMSVPSEARVKIRAVDLHRGREHEKRRSILECTNRRSGESEG